MAVPTVEHMIIHFASTPEEVLVCPGKTGPNAKAKPGEPIATIDGICYTWAGLEEQVREAEDKLRQAERELAKQAKKPK